MKLPIIPRISHHGSEVLLLGVLSIGVIYLTARAIGQIDPTTGGPILDITAFLLVLQRIVEAVQKRWEQRGADAVTQSLANSRPLDDSPTGNPGDPVHTQEEK